MNVSTHYGQGFTEGFEADPRQDAAYEILEVIENLFLDFTEASSWKEQWAVCEGLVMFILGPGSDFFT